MNPTTVQLIGAVIFAVAVLHTFSVKFFEKLAHRHPAHAGIFHLLGEVEAVFGFWALVLVCFILVATGPKSALDYLNGRDFTEPLFVVAIMVLAARKPLLRRSRACGWSRPSRWMTCKPSERHRAWPGCCPLNGFWSTCPA